MVHNPWLGPNIEVYSKTVNAIYDNSAIWVYQSINNSLICYFRLKVNF
jgi:hypothetical protein